MSVLVASHESSPAYFVHCICRLVIFKSELFEKLKGEGL